MNYDPLRNYTILVFLSAVMDNNSTNCLDGSMERLRVMEICKKKRANLVHRSFSDKHLRNSRNSLHLCVFKYE